MSPNSSYMFPNQHCFHLQSMDVFFKPEMEAESQALTIVYVDK